MDALPIYKGCEIAKALIHVLRGNGKNTFTTNFAAQTLILPDINIEKYGDEIGQIVGQILHDHTLKEEAVGTFMGLMGTLSTKYIIFTLTKKLVEGVCRATEHFIKNERICLNFFKIFFSKARQEAERKTENICNHIKHIVTILVYSRDQDHRSYSKNNNVQFKQGCDMSQWM